MGTLKRRHGNPEGKPALTPRRLAVHSQCGILAYATRDDAKKASKISAERGGDPLARRPVSCEDCGLWHITTLHPVVMRGEMTEAEVVASRPDARNRSQAAQIRRMRDTVGHQISREGYDYATAWADHTIGDRSHADWEAERRFALEFLGWLPRHIKHINAAELAEIETIPPQ